MAEVDDETETVAGWDGLPDLVDKSKLPTKSTGQHGPTKAERMDRLRALEDQLLEQSLTIVKDTMHFRDIEPGTTEPPAEWVDADQDDQTKRLRVANAAWLSKKDAPVGLALAKEVSIGIIKARATEKSGPKVLNLNVVNMSAPLPQFECIEVESDER